VQIDPRRLRPGELWALLGAVLLAVALFEPWFQFSGGRQDAWNALTATAIVAAIAVIGALARVATTLTQRSPSLPLAAAVCTAVLAFIATVLIAIAAASPPGAASERCFGLWLGLAGVVALLVGAWLSLRDERPFWGVLVSR
jgi:predicted membrane channel-forming protein YqfA (hemolysin III family)